MILQLIIKKKYAFVLILSIIFYGHILYSQEKYHTVQAGDNLYQISKKYNMSVDDLKRINSLQSDNLKVGQIIYVEYANAKPKTYKVKAGDNLSIIARKHDISVSELRKLNNLRSDNLAIGQVIIVRKEQVAPASNANSNAQNFTYIVKAGDNLYRIALNHNVSKDQLMALNNLDNDIIKVGQKIKIPTNTHVNVNNTISTGGQQTANTTAKYHIVKKYQTLSELATLYKIDIIDLLDYNNLNDFDVREGQRIWLEPGQIEQQEDAPAEKESKPIKSVTVHSVAKGETLYRIASIYDVSVEDLQKWNKLSSVTLKEGQRVYIGDPVGLHTEEDIERAKPYEKPKTTYSKTPILPVNRINIVSEFGMRSGKMHKGIDLAEPTGSPIYAVLPGKVVFAGVQRGYGNVIIVEHENFQMTVYSHNDANFVNAGEDVTQGQILGTVGSTGNASGPHLHFEYRVRGVAINPGEFLIGL